MKQNSNVVLNCNDEYQRRFVDVEIASIFLYFYTVCTLTGAVLRHFIRPTLYLTLDVITKATIYPNM